MIVARARDFPSWRDEARRLLAASVRPEDVHWDDGIQASLFGSATNTSEATSREWRSTSSAAKTPAAPAPKVPAAFVEKAEIAAFHADSQKFAVLYRLLWKLTHVDRNVLGDPIDPDTQRLEKMLREIREDEHAMHAFVRFRQSGDHWIAWYRPKHPVLALVAPFFARRYPNMTWSIVTPDASAHWDCEAIHFGPGSGTDVAPPPDALDELFVTYYASIFNPARTNLPLLRQHIPSRVQALLPEGKVMDRLARESVTRVARLTTKAASASEALLPVARDLESLRAAAHTCRACPIGERATQTVFGEGPRDAALVIVGEQPGDDEDLAGRPFVGPAGRLLDTWMNRAGLPRERIYVTNAVKHFKWEPRGKRRLHSRPSTSEIHACSGWLHAEIDAIKPRMILCLGATAAQSFAGAGFRIARDRGQPTKTPWAEWWMASYHPSALLRAEGDAERTKLEQLLLADLIVAREALASLT